MCHSVEKTNSLFFYVLISFIVDFLKLNTNPQGVAQTQQEIKHLIYVIELFNCGNEVVQKKSK